MKNSLRKSPRGTGLSAVVLGVSALVLSGCGAPPAEEAPGSTAAAETDYLGCIVSDSGGFDDRSFNQSSYEGLKQAEADLGIQINQAESQAETDFGPNVDSMVQAGCDMTVTVGFLLADTTKAAAEANPDANFAIVDDNSIDLPNVKPIIYDTAQAAFLAGYAAAAASETGKVATYGGINIPTVTIFMDGFADGITYYNELTASPTTTSRTAPRLNCSAGTRKPRTARSSATSMTRVPARPTRRTSSTRAPTSSCRSPGRWASERSTL